MRFSQFFASVVCLCAATAVAQAAPTPAEIIQKARAKVGTEAQLTSIKSLSMTGKVLDKDDKEVGYLEISCKLPDMHKEYLVGASAQQLASASNGLEGYRRLGQRIQPLSFADIRRTTDRLQAETGFYSVPKDGTVTYEAEVSRVNKSCYSLVYKYKGGTHYRRFFDKATGQFVAQEIYAEANTPEDKRQFVVEEGEFFVDSIRFPKKVTNYVGGKKESSIEYTKITLNPELSDAEFAFPMP